MNKRIIILFVVVIFIVGAIYYFESMKAKPSENFNIDTEEEIRHKPLLKDGQFPLAPELVGISGFLNSEEGIKISNFEGKVVLIDFWTYTCINCIRTFPYLIDWDEKYRDSGLVIIGVHTPEFEFEKEKENVQASIDKYDIEYRVVQDNDYATWRAYENRYWPRKYLIDSEGYIRYDHIGEGGYEETELKIQELLAEIGSDNENIEITPEEKFERFETTPELYAGYEFGIARLQNVGNLEGSQVNKFSEYILPEELNGNTIYLEGVWKSSRDNLESGDGGGSVILGFIASEVNIVADSLTGPNEMEVLINGDYVSEEHAGEDVQFSKDKSFVIINEPRLYNIFDGIHGDYSLELKVRKGFVFNAFTFG